MVKECSHKYKYYGLTRDFLDNNICFEIERCSKCGDIKSISISKEKFDELSKEKRRSIFENRSK